MSHVEREVPHQHLAAVAILARVPDMRVKKSSQDASPRHHLRQQRRAGDQTAELGHPQSVRHSNK